MYNSDDAMLILMLSGTGACSLDSSPKKNWVQKSGGLPNYICNVAKGVMKSGKSKSAAIAIAVSTVKKWAAGGKDVNADTRVKAAAAVAAWEALKAKNKAGKVHLAADAEGETYVILSNIPSFNTNIVRAAWDGREREARQARKEAREAKRKAAAATASDPDGDGDNDTEDDDDGSPVAFPSYRWVMEVWTDFIIVQSDTVSGQVLTKISYTVDPTTFAVVFGQEIPVHTEYVEESDALSKWELDMIASMSATESATSRIIALSSKQS